MRDDFGDRMKEYEGMEAGRRFMPGLPIIARIDGRSFHNFTKGMTRPFDEIFTKCMIETTIALVKETGASCGFSQSDEISLCWYVDNPKQQVWFDGRIQKMTSQLGAQATLFFYREVLNRMPQYSDRMPSFDARVWNVPNLSEGANVFLWREWDATKNSISMAASSYYSHKTLHEKTGSEKQEMLFQKGINWNDYPTYFKRGTYVQRREEVIPFTAEELSKLPEKHAARLNPDLKVTRSTVKVLDLPPLGSIQNREKVIFFGAEPELIEQ
jgi:tRNA(His) 5'-end guanylyltransferase